MKFLNKDAFFKSMEAAVMRGIEEDIVPVFKGVVLDAARALVEGAFAYAGTPEWSGNAAANWWPSYEAGVQPFVKFFSDVPRPGEKDFVADFKPPYSAQTPRVEAVALSLGRIEAFLKEMPAVPKQVVIQNTAPYLQEYQPYGEGKLFRLENLYPLSAMRAAVFMNERVATATQQQLIEWKTGF